MLHILQCYIHMYIIHHHQLSYKKPHLLTIALAFVAGAAAVATLEHVHATFRWYATLLSESRSLSGLRLTTPETLLVISLSMDWFKGKFTPESPIFNGRISGFL